MSLSKCLSHLRQGTQGLVTMMSSFGALNTALPVSTCANDEVGANVVIVAKLIVINSFIFCSLTIV